MKRNSARSDRRKRSDEGKVSIGDQKEEEVIAFANRDSPQAPGDSVEGSSSQLTVPNDVQPIRRVQSIISFTAPPKNPSTASTAASSSAISNDAEDFFTIARAKGLNLTRQQYELARAGVSAFLRAERVSNSVGTPPGTAPTTSSSSTVSKSQLSRKSESQEEVTKNGKAQSPKENQLTQSSKASADIRKLNPPSSNLNRTLSNNTHSTLSFFTAVLPLENLDVPPRPRLDDIGSLEERRRRREKRRRMRERAEREANDADCETGSHSRGRKAASEPVEDSPSTGVGAYDTPVMSNNSNRSPRSRALRMKATSFDLDTLTRVGLGIMGESPSGTAHSGSERLSEIRTSSPNEGSISIREKLDSPSLSKLTKKAHIDETGRLTLLPSPIKDLSTMNEDMMMSISGYDEHAANGGETDDSGICLTCESNSQCKKPSGPSSSPSNRRRINSFGSSSNNDLYDSMDKLSFLDRIMAQKKSPLRLRKEAKARERRERLLAANNDLIVMTATTRPPLQMTSIASSSSNPVHLPVTNEAANSTLPSNDGKSVRWANDFNFSPRKRMTTKEMYDFEFYGIAPAMQATWEQGESEQNRSRMPTNDDLMLDGFGHTRMRSQVNSTMFGSPVASRTSQNMIPDSPGLLSLAFHDSALQSAALLAKRGLLFGSTTPNGSSVMIATPPVPSPHEGNNALGNDLHNIFSQGPTLARSPARKGLIETETPPRLVRSKTLAAPISLAQSVFGGSNSSNKEPSPQRKSLVRAHSSSVVENNSKQATQDANKENVYQSGDKKIIPAGWANRNTSGRLDTISPAAIFGLGQNQLSSATSKKNEARVLQDSQRQNTFQQRIRMISNGSVSDSGLAGHFSTSDIEGDDEHDLSPTVHMHGKRAQSKKKKQDRHGRNNSSSASSAYDDSPLMLDTRSNKATVVVRPVSGNSLARALDLPLNRDNESKTPHMTSMTMEWDKPDGSRVVKLVSEELQAALESGSLPIEPPARFYKYPLGWGKSKDKPQSVSYAGMIGQAILSSSDGRLSLNEIYNWISTVFPFFERGDRGWQNSIRHNLSLNKSFEKVERAANVPGKGGWWAIKEGHEERFKNGNYYAPGSIKAAKDTALKTPKTGTLPLPSSGSLEDSVSGNKQMGSTNSVNKMRRKRVESGGSKNGSDSDVALSSVQSVNGSTSKTSRKRVKKIKMNKNGTKDSHSSVSQEVEGKSIPVTLLKPNQESGSGIVSPSPKQYSTITPSRPYQPRTSIGTSSSDFGSVYASSTMAGMPVLTDASSPPSSPNNTMPPPPGGIRGAASTQSAQKQREALLRQQLPFQDLNLVYQNHGNVQMSSFISTPYGLQMSNAYSQHALPASPLAHMRGNGGNLTSNHGNHLANGRLRNNNVTESPLRQTVTSNGGQTSISSSVTNPTSLLETSPSRLIVNSPPVSNVRGETADQDEHMNGDKENGTKGSKLHQSPARFVNHSPLRGSPLRPGGPLNQQNNTNGNLTTSQSSMMLSPAGMHLQMAFGGNGNNGTSFSSNSGAPMASTPIMQRWAMGNSPLSSRIFSPGQTGFLTPNTHGHLIGNGTSNNTPGGGGGGLDDPFDYSGNLQHELDMASELHHLTSTIQQGEPSPMKGFDHHSLGRTIPFHHQNQPQQTVNSADQSMESISSVTHHSTISSFNPFLPSQG